VDLQVRSRTQLQFRQGLLPLLKNRVLRGCSCPRPCSHFF
jgi:hypothetical protein